MKYVLVIAFLMLVVGISAQTKTDQIFTTGDKPLSQQLAATAMHLWKDSFTLEGDKVAKWRYDQGVILKGIEGIWNATGEGQYFHYINKSMDFYVQDDGSIKGYRPDEFNIDHINNGKLLLLLYRVTGKEKYKKAVDLLRQQLRDHPRTSEGGFWHKKIYPSQMWLDGLYMGQPFYAEYAMLFHEDTAFNDIARQFVLMEKHARDSKTGLLYHGWDESRQQKWANTATGLSPNFWGRALGWYGMAMVDALDHFPAEHPGRKSIIEILKRFSTAVVKYQDQKTGLWYDIVDKRNEPKNYFEASASSMLVYTLAKAVRMGYISSSFRSAAKKGWSGIVNRFIKKENDQVNLHGTVAVSGLGGNPYRDGSFAYYMSEPVIVNDPKGMGAFLNAAVEMEMISTQNVGAGKTVLLDYYFNNEWRKDATGTNVRFHYTWEDKSNSGFAMLGDVFRIHGMKTDTIETPPTAAALKKASVYLIVDPDTEKETAKPHFISENDIRTISNWVKGGGVLVLMGNDSANSEFTNWNKLANAFGLKFNENSLNKVVNNVYPQGELFVSENPIFKQAKRIFIKELSTIEGTGIKNIILKKGNDNVIVTASYGKGLVFAVGDPWLYNEYIDGRRLPTDFDNYKATVDLVRWLAKVSKTIK